MAFFGILRRRRHERTGHELYVAAVLAARQPYYYTTLAVPDTLDGRFDLVGLHAFLLIRRLRSLPRPGEALAQAVFDAMFGDMDVNLREMGVGDLSVGRKVRVMWEAFHGRSNAYQAALDQQDPAALAAAIGRNLWPESAPAGAPAILAAIVAGQDRHLAVQSLESFVAGKVDFLAPGPLAAGVPA